MKKPVMRKGTVKMKRDNGGGEERIMEPFLGCEHSRLHVNFVKKNFYLRLEEKIGVSVRALVQAESLCEKIQTFLKEQMVAIGKAGRLTEGDIRLSTHQIIPRVKAINVNMLGSIA